VQTRQDHSAAFAERVAAYEQALAAQEGSSAAETTEEQRSRIEAHGMTAAQSPSEIRQTSSPANLSEV